MTGNDDKLEMSGDVRGFLGMERQTGAAGDARERPPSFDRATDDFDFETQADRRARFMASSRMLFTTDVSRLDNPGAAALYQSVTEGMFGLRDENGSLAFGKRASSDPHENINMLRRFVKGEYSLIEDPEYTTWRQMDEEAKFRYALEHEGWMNKAKSDLKGERGSSILEKIALMGTSSAPGFQLPDETRKDIIRRSNYEDLNDEEKAKYRADVIGDYEEKLSRRQTLATFLQYSQGLSDRASYLLAKSFSEGRIDENVMLMNDKSERDRVLSAFSLMRGDQKKGRFLGIEMDFTDDTWANRLQLGLYGLQQSVVGLVTDTADMVQNAAIWTYAKTALDESERKQFFEAWDANVRAEQAMQQSLPEADSFGGEMFQGVMENLHWIIPYGAITKGGKMMKAARGIKEEQGFFKSIGTALTPMRLGGDLNKQKAVAEVSKAIAEANVAATRAAYTLDINGVKKLGEYGSSLVARQIAAVESYTQRLRSIDADLKAAKWWKDAAGAGMWAAGEASAFSAFASEYIATADAAGISREDSVLTAAFVGAINALVERLYVPGLESSLSPAQLKSMMWSTGFRAIRSDGAAGFRKWFSNRIPKDVAQIIKVATTEGLVEEPLQQIVQEHAKAFDAMCGELRENGQATAANEAKAFWDSVVKTLPNDYATFIDTAIDMLPSSVGFGLASVRNMKNRQHIHNVLTRHANRRAGATAKDTMLSLDQRGEDPSKAFDYDAGLVDMIQQAVNVRNAVDRHWRDAGKEDKNPHRFEEAVTAARRAWRSPKTRDAVQEIADAAQVDVKTAEVLAQYFQTEAESTAFSPQARAWTALNMSLADIDEATIKTVLPGYVEGSFASDPENGIYSGRVKMDDGTEKTIAYRVGDIAPFALEIAKRESAIDSDLGKSFDERMREAGRTERWATIGEAARYDAALRSVNGFASGKRGVFELTDSKGEKVLVNADDIIFLANGRLADIGYGAAATQGTVRHETFHSLWRFVRATLKDADVQQLAKTLGIDVTKDRWEVTLDERMAHEMERYASGHYVSHAVSSKFDALMRGWAGKAVDFFGKFGPSDEVTDPKTGKPYQMKGLYDSILRGELGSGALGVELRKVPAQPAPQNSPDGRTASGQSTLPVPVTDAERATAEAEAQAEAAATEPPAPEQPVPPVSPVSPAATTVPAATSENPADAATPNQVYYRVGLPNSNVKLVGRLEVRDASTGVITSTDADYHDRGNQNRDDKSEESRALVEKIGANPDPLQVGTVQPIASNGIVWALPNGDVIIGNHRVNGVRLGYEKGTAGELEKFVREDAAKRGIEIGADVKKPLTVFVLERIESPDGKADVHEVVRLANESQNRGFNIREQAGNDAKILQDNNLLPRMEFRADGRIDETKSGDAIGKFRQESGAQGLVAEDGSLTEEGQTRLTNAALAVLLGGEGNNALLNKIMTNAGRLGMQSELRALMKMTPELMALAEAKPAYDLRAPLAEALQLFTEWRDRDETARVEKGKTRHDWCEMKNGRRVRGLSWEAYLSQGDMFRTPSDEAKILGDLFAKAESLRSFDREDVESEAGKKRVIDLISGYLADYIANARAVNTDTEDMFGGTPASRAEVMAAQRATGGENGAARFSIGAEEAQRQYDEVVARYTNEDGTKKRGWMKAPNGKPTRLSERQWVQVRTPAFKAWFGDWEAAANRKALGWYDVADVSSITGIEPKTVPDVRPVPDKAAMVELFKSFGEVKNAHDGRVVRFPTKSAGKMIYKKNVAHAFKTLFISSIRAFSEKETLFEGHKSHPNVRAYHHYINKFKTAAGTFYIRFAVRDDHNGSNVHNAEISDIEIYNENGATQFGNQTDGKLHPADGKMPFTDIKITYFLAGVNGENAISSKVVDENGEPLVVWHGSTWNPIAEPSGAAVFRTGEGETGSGAHFGTRQAAEERGSDRKNWNLASVFLNMRNPLRVADTGYWTPGDIVAEVRKTEEDFPWLDNWDEIKAELKRRGYDGMVYENAVEDEGSDSYIAFEPTQIKSATDNTGAFSPRNPDIRYSIGGIYTGAAADYANRSRQGGKDDGPSLLKVGTGEGSQVYGWGLYGSTVRGVAEGYAVPNHLTPEGLAASTLRQYEGKRSDAIKRLQGYVESGALSYRKLSQDEIERTQKAIQILKDHKEASTHLYEQTFFTDRAPGDESHLLKWYEPITSEQIEWVAKEIENYDPTINSATFVKSGLTGEDLYINLCNFGKREYGVSTQEAPKFASELLRDAGIDGVKYPVDSFGGKSVKDGDEAGWNYVSFRDDNIRVDHKWTDGQQRYSIATLGKYNTDDLRDLAHRVKDGDSAAIADAGRRLAKILPKNAVLVPMPSRTGEPTTMRALADAIAANADGATVVDALRSNPHESSYERKKRGDEPEEVEMRRVAEIPKGREVYVVDNVIDTGATYHAAMRTIHDAHLLALADTDKTPAELRQTIAQTVKDPDVQIEKESADQRYSVFAGEKTATPRLLKPLAEAKALLGDGEYTDAVRRKIYDKTGWWRGTDGKWRVELPNLKAKYIDDSLLVEFADSDVILEKYGWNEYSAYWLRDLVTFPKGLKANTYELGETLVFFVDEEQMKSASGGEDASAATFVRVEQGLFGPQVICEIHVVDPMVEDRERKGKQRLAQSTLDSLTHELQHVIQLREGFAFGGNTADAGGDKAYGAAAGEVEARNAARRNDPRYRTRPPWATEDVPARYQSVGYSGWEWTDADGWRPMAETAALSPASVRPAAEGRRYSVSAPLVEAMQDRERRENAPRAPQGESPFFAEAEGAVEIPIHVLRTVKDEPERSIRSAAFKMRRAAAGRIPKRAPVSVVDNGDGTYTVIDGNATTWAAARGGLEAVRANIVGKDRGTRLANSHYLVDEDSSGCDADGKLHTHGLDGLPGEAAREKAYGQADENAPLLKAAVDAAAKAVGGEALHRKSVKRRQRVDEKAASYGGDYSRVVDLIGGTIVLDPSQDMADALKAIRRNLPQGASVAKVKRLSSPDENGYWDIKVSVRFANGGIGEIIIVDRNINDAKFNRGGHDLYDFERALEEELKRGANGNSQVESLYKALRDLEEAIYSHKTEKAARYQAAEWDLTKASASDSVTHLMPGITDALSEEFIGLLKELLSGSHLQRPASLASQATPARSFIQNDISDSSLLGKINNGIISNSPLKVNSENEIDANLPRFSTEAPRSGLVYPQLRSMSDDELLSAAVAVRMALGKSEKFSDKVVKVNTVQNMMRRLHPDWDNSRIGLETNRVLSDARKFGKRIREDLDRGVSDSLILEHLPQAAREQFGLEMRQEARKGQSLGAFGQKVASEIEERQVRVVEDAVRVQTGLDAGAIENTFGINLSETIMRLAANPLKEEGKDTATGATGEGVSEDGQAELGQDEPPAAIDAKVKSVVDDIVAASKTSADADERNRAERRAAAARDAETQAVENGDDGSVPAGEPAGEGDDLAAACAKEALNLENPRHLARFVAELARRQWIKEHGLAKDADVWRDLVAVQFLRKTAQSVYAKLCRDLVYSRSRETAMQRIAKFDNVPTVAGLLSEMEFVGALINAQRIRDTQKQMCEKLDLFLKESFGAQGRFRPDKEEGKRKVSAEAELRARYMRHAMWLTPTAAAEEARQLQETLDALSVDFKDAGRDRDQSREFVETIRKLNVLREFGALRYKPVGEIEAAAQWWEDFARGESDDIVREMSDRDIRTKKAAHLLAVAFADPKRTTIREGGKADALNRFITGHMGFISLLQDCMRHASDADAAAVKDIVDYISREIQKSGDRSEAEKRRHNDAFHAAVESIYGKSFNSVMKDMMAPDERFTKYMGVVGGKRVTPTKGRALQLLVSLLQEGRKVQVENEDNPGQTKTVWEGGYHDNIVKHHREGQAAEIMRLLNPADMNMLKWLGQWYENNRSDLSGVCHSLFGIGVYAELPNYFPVKMQLETQGLEKGNGVGWTIFPKALTPRVRNERDFDTSADIFSMWASRMEEAAQWKHHAQLGLEMRGIFGRAELREAVRANHGVSVDELMQGFITDILAGHGAYDRSTAGVQYFSDQIRGWTALCALGGNIGVTFKQTTSIPAFGFEIGLVNTAKYMVSAFTPEGMAAMRRIWNSEQRRTRWQVGSSEAVRNALNQQGAGALKRMLQASMVTTKVGDVVPGLVVGQGIYRDCLARGMPEEDAMAETWSIIERTQQSGRMENQTSIQRRNKLGRIMFQFLSTQQQYLQYEVRAIREVIARPDSVKRWGNLGRAILLNHFILSSAYYWMGQLYKYALGQEPPEDELKDWIVTCLLGPYGSLFVAGFCCKYTLERAIKGYSIKGGSSMLPMESWLKNQVNDGAKLLEAIFDSDGDTWDNMLEAAGRWMSDSNSVVRDLRKIYRYRIEGEPQKKR